MECANGTSAGAGVGAVGNRLKVSDTHIHIPCSDSFLPISRSCLS
jgi:hypothetical protein